MKWDQYRLFVRIMDRQLSYIWFDAMEETDVLGKGAAVSACGGNGRR
jgi:hypothetical protein